MQIYAKSQYIHNPFVALSVLTDFNNHSALKKYLLRCTINRKSPKIMKQNAFIIALFTLLTTNTFAQKITTLSPLVNEQSQRYIEITKVVLTAQNTILYFHIDNRPKSIEDLMYGNASLVEIDPKCKLIDSRNENRTFRYVRAEGISVAPRQQTLEIGKSLDFAVYFERIDAGIELFDLYEGKDYRNKTDNRHYWNFYGIHIRNPKAIKTPTVKPVIKPVIIPKTDSIKTPVADTIKTTEATLTDKKLIVGEAVTLNNIYFEVGKFDLLPASFTELDQLVKRMEDSPEMAIRIEGHTDKMGDFDENLKLSLNRANAVKGYLVGKGIDFGRIETKGYGSTRPATKSTAETERRKNRRVEFVVVKLRV
jgi:outer membrane protein OmpA-like peptidoglycan-associated protein